MNKAAWRGSPSIPDTEVKNELGFLKLAMIDQFNDQPHQERLVTGRRAVLHDIIIASEAS